jgi:signal transduction histidine kinase
VGLLAAGFAVLIANAMFSLWVGSRTSSFINHTVTDQALKSSLAGLLSAAQDAETGQRGYLLTGDEQYLQPYQAAVTDMPMHLRALESMAGENEHLRVRLPHLREVADRRMSLVNNSVSFIRGGDRDKALSQLNSGLGKTTMDELRAVTSELTALQDAMISQGLANLNRSEAWARFINLAALALIVALAATTGGIVSRFVRELEDAQGELRTVNAGLERIVDERTSDIVRANEEIQRFAYIVSHDLRAPLVNIMGFTSELEAIGKMVGRQYETLAQRAPDLVLPETPEAVRDDLPEAIGFIRTSTAKMDRLINAILGLSREGRRVLTPVNVDMTALVTGIADSMKHQIDAVGGTISVGKLPAVITDKLAIEQVFSNLMENASKYIEPGRAPQIKVEGRSEGSQMFYTIADNGRGIDEKDMERVFELFRRAGKQDQPGEGLGLAFVRAAVRRLGGTISVQSELGKGTTFTLRFPSKLQLSRSKNNG